MVCVVFSSDPVPLIMILVAVFAAVLLPDQPTALTSALVSILGKRAFLRYFIL